MIILPTEAEILKQGLFTHIHDAVLEKGHLELTLLKTKYSINIMRTIFHDTFDKEFEAVGAIDTKRGVLLFPDDREKAYRKSINKRIQSYECLSIELDAVDLTLRELENRYRTLYKRSFFAYRI